MSEDDVDFENDPQQTGFTHHLSLIALVDH